MSKTLMMTAAAFAMTLTTGALTAGTANAQIAGGLGGNLGGSIGGSVGGVGGSLGGAGSGGLTGGLDSSFARDRVDGTLSRADRARANAERRAERARARAERTAAAAAERGRATGDAAVSTVGSTVNSVSAQGQGGVSGEGSAAGRDVSGGLNGSGAISGGSVTGALDGSASARRSEPAASSAAASDAPAAPRRQARGETEQTRQPE